MTARSSLSKIMPSMVPFTTGVVQRFSYFPNYDRKRIVLQASRRGMSALEELGREKRAEEVGIAATTVDKIEYERPLKIVGYPDPRLRLPNARIRLPATGIEQLAEDMFQVMYKDDGIGLAAPQVGVNIQMMVFNPDGPDAQGEKSKEMVLINPKIIKFSNSKSIYDEACLSFYRPVLIRGGIERPSLVKIKAQSLSGEKINLTLEELPARIFQHEYDHLQGVLFFERMSPEVLSTVRDDLIRYEEEYISKNPTVQIQRIK